MPNSIKWRYNKQYTTHDTPIYRSASQYLYTILYLVLWNTSKRRFDNILLVVPLYRCDYTHKKHGREAEDANGTAWRRYHSLKRCRAHHRLYTWHLFSLIRVTQNIPPLPFSSFYKNLLMELARTFFSVAFLWTHSAVWTPLWRPPQWWGFGGLMRNWGSWL